MRRKTALLALALLLTFLPGCGGDSPTAPSVGSEQATSARPADAELPTKEEEPHSEASRGLVAASEEMPLQVPKEGITPREVPKPVQRPEEAPLSSEAVYQPNAYLEYPNSFGMRYMSEWHAFEKDATEAEIAQWKELLARLDPAALTEVELSGTYPREEIKPGSWPLTCEEVAGIVESLQQMELSPLPPDDGKRYPDIGGSTTYLFLQTADGDWMTFSSPPAGPMRIYSSRLGGSYLVRGYLSIPLDEAEVRTRTNTMPTRLAGDAYLVNPPATYMHEPYYGSYERVAVGDEEVLQRYQGFLQAVQPEELAHFLLSAEALQGRGIWRVTGTQVKETIAALRQLQPTLLQEEELPGELQGETLYLSVEGPDGEETLAVQMDGTLIGFRFCDRFDSEKNEEDLHLYRCSSTLLSDLVEALCARE